MILYLQIFLILSASIMILILNQVRRKTNLTYIVTLVAILLSFGLTFLLRLMLPYSVILSDWQIFINQNLFLEINNDNWLLGIVWQSLLVFYVASYPARKDYLEIRKSFGVFFLSILGLLIIFSANLITYLFVWTILFFILVVIKLLKKEQTFSWIFLILFLLWGLLNLGIFSGQNKINQGQNFNIVSGSLKTILLILSILLLSFKFIKNEIFSFFDILIKVLSLLVVNNTLLNIDVSNISKSLVIFYEIIIILVFIFISIKLLFNNNKISNIESSFLLLQLLIVFLILSGISKIGNLLLIIWISFIIVLSINKIEDRVFIILRRFYIIIGILFPFIMGNNTLFFLDANQNSILFSFLIVVFLIVLLRISNGKSNFYYSETSWLNFSIEDHEWYRIDDWAKILHWFGVIFLWGTVWVSLIWINPESLLDIGYSLPWQLLLILIFTLGIFGIWRFRRKWLVFIEKIGSFSFSIQYKVDNYPIIEKLIRIAEIPEEILESSSGVFWTLLFILFIISLVL